MLPLGHTGVTLGVVWALSAAARSLPVQGRVSQSNSPQPGHRIWRLLRSPDLRLVLVGSLFPDIVDKPLWLVAGALNTGRAFSHGLVFPLVLMALGLVLYWRYGRVSLWSLGVGSLLHVLEDQMWRDPATFLWPAYGWTFREHVASGWAAQTVNSLSHSPRVYVPEVLGAIIIIVFVVTLLRKRGMVSFLRSGAISGARSR